MYSSWKDTLNRLSLLHSLSFPMKKKINKKSTLTLKVYNILLQMKSNQLQNFTFHASM